MFFNDSDRLSMAMHEAGAVHETEAMHEAGAVHEAEARNITILTFYLILLNLLLSNRSCVFSFSDRGEHLAHRSL